MSSTHSDCPFCRIAERDPDAQIMRVIGDAFVIEPLNPVTPGHLLVIPIKHVEHASEAPATTAATMHAAALVARDTGSCNLITSIGAAATQTVRHLHIHVVPRRAGDGLSLPWTNQEALMAGSYNHATTDAGHLRSNESFAQMIENIGDAYEMAEEMYGMIWFLAYRYMNGNAEAMRAAVENARENHQRGLELAREANRRG